MKKILIFILSFMFTCVLLFPAAVASNIGSVLEDTWETLIEIMVMVSYPQLNKEYIIKNHEELNELLLIACVNNLDEDDRMECFNSAYLSDNESEIVENGYFEMYEEALDNKYKLFNGKVVDYEFISMLDLPIKGKKVKNSEISSEYGFRIFDDLEFHNALDFPANKGTSLLAIYDGEVIDIGYNDISGNYIVYKTNNILDYPEPICEQTKKDSKGNVSCVLYDWSNTKRPEEQHSLQLVVQYNHMDSIDASIGDRIMIGENVGTVGETGTATGPHLHFSIKYILDNHDLGTASPYIIYQNLK